MRTIKNKKLVVGLALGTAAADLLPSGAAKDLTVTVTNLNAYSVKVAGKTLTLDLGTSPRMSRVAPRTRRCCRPRRSPATPTCSARPAPTPPPSSRPPAPAPSSPSGRRQLTGAVGRGAVLPGATISERFTFTPSPGANGNVTVERTAVPGHTAPPPVQFRL